MGSNCRRKSKTWQEVDQIDFVESSKLYQGCETGFNIMRYHSLISDEKSFPNCLKITGRTPDAIQSFEHQINPHFGIQYHQNHLHLIMEIKIINTFVNITKEGAQNEHIKTTHQYRNLDQQEMKSFVQLMMNETEDVSLKVAHLVALSMKGETSDELSYLTENLIATTYKNRPYIEDSICVCGTGGDHSGSFNISTTASFVVAAAGLKVLKHGNKSITSKTGSIDILSALNIQTTPINEATKRVNDTNLAF